LSGRVAPGRLRDPWILLALGGGAGLSPRAPGTLGTLVAVPLYLLCLPLSRPLYGLLLVALFLLGIVICAQAARRLGVHDHPAIVWDEIVGYLATLFLLHPLPPAHRGAWLLAAFVLFRLFDILKPWPIGWLDRRLRGGLGIMLDDLVAGVLAGLILYVGRI